MNAAFSRGEAIVRLENLAIVIVTHLALSNWFQKHPAQKHWAVELDAFKKALSRYDEGKMKKGYNFTSEIVAETLRNEIDDGEKKDDIILLVTAHGVIVEDPDWDALEKAITDFSKGFAKR